MEMLRVWPIVCEFGIGAILCMVGIWCGLRGGYLNLKNAEDRRLLLILVGGYFFMLGIMCIFTFLSPNWANGVGRVGKCLFLPMRNPGACATSCTPYGCVLRA